MRDGVGVRDVVGEVCVCVWGRIGVRDVGDEG